MTTDDERREAGRQVQGQLWPATLTGPTGRFPAAELAPDFFDDVQKHAFGDIWTRPGLSDRDRRLLLIGMLAGQGAADVLGIQIPAAHAAGELDDDALREIVVFLSHYAGWPQGARLNSIVEETIAKARRKQG